MSIGGTKFRIMIEYLTSAMKLYLNRSKMINMDLAMSVSSHVDCKESLMTINLLNLEIYMFLSHYIGSLILIWTKLSRVA
jgi:hypothetical protein